MGHVLPYWNSLQNCAYNDNEYSATAPKECEAYKCFEILLQREEVHNVLRNGNGLRLLRQIIDRDAFVQLLFETNTKYKLGLEKSFCRYFGLSLHEAAFCFDSVFCFCCSTGPFE